MSETPKVGILMGSDSDLPVMEEAFRVLDDFRIPYEARVLSAHRSPEESAEYARRASDRGLQVIIAGAGWAAHLAGVIAAATTLPVIGVPIDSSPLHGLDSLFSTVQMPPGIPVATMAIGRGGARNAAIFAAQVLATNDVRLAGALRDMKRQMAEDVMAKKNRKLEEYLSNREKG